MNIKNVVMLATVWCCGIMSVEAQEQAEEFTVATLNVDGLPAELIVSVNPEGPGEKYTPEIADYLLNKNYDIVGFQENFNFYDLLFEKLETTYLHDLCYGKMTLETLTIPFPYDGVNLIWKKDISGERTDSVQWEQSYGMIDHANDELTNGQADEFEVKNAYLYLFKGTSEATATYLKRYSLTNSFENDTQGAGSAAAQSGVTMPGGTGVTSTSVSVCRIQNVSLTGSEKLYAYVVVNAQGGLAAEPAVGKPFSEFTVQELAAADNGGTLEGLIGTDGLLMTNSPISDKAAGDAAPTGEKITTLVELNASNIKMTEAEAKAAPAGCVYVERAAAKVTVADHITGVKKITMDGVDLTYAIKGWMVINTEPKFYNARQLDQTWDPLFSQYWTGKNTTYRFISKYSFAPTLGDGSHTTGYRTYFAKDMQYDSDATLEHTVAGETGRNWLALTGRAFVPENTFDVDRQQRKNTTQVTLKVQFGDGSDLYTISDDAKFYTASNIDATVAAKVQTLYNVNKFMEDLAAYEVTAMHTAHPTKYFKVTVNLSATVDKTAAKDDAPYTVAYSMDITESDAVDGTYTASSETAEALNSTLTAAWTAAKDEAEAALTVSLYKEGMSYYNVRIQHFGEYETPWSSSRATQPGETIEQIYGATATRTADYLGRYSVVRDNWYNLSIDGIAKLGSAEPKSVNGDPTPDDEIEKEYYISAHVHILPWVLRTQSVNF